MLLCSFIFDQTYFYIDKYVYWTLMLCHISYWRAYLLIFAGSRSVFFFMEKQFSQTSSFMETSLPQPSFVLERFRSLPQISSVSEKMIPPISSFLEQFIESSNALAAQAIYDHELVLDFLKFTFNAESAQATRDIPFNASFSELNISLDKSSRFYLYFSCNASLLICMDSPLLRL